MPWVISDEDMQILESKAATLPSLVLSGIFARAIEVTESDGLDDEDGVQAVWIEVKKEEG
jgi:hypothetical protein